MDSPRATDKLDAIVVGGGPAGLRAAEVLAAGGAHVAVYDQKPSVGRKFLVAGRGGLNLTHSEPIDGFVARYGDESPRWRELLAAFGPDDLRAWAGGLGVETYVGTSGRVFPRGQQAAVLLRRWVSRLRAAGVAFHVGQRLEGIAPGAVTVRDTRDGNGCEVSAAAVILALGGASWPQTGSNGEWPSVLASAAPGLAINSWQPANCGWNVAWDPRVLAAAEGMPIKNIAVTAGGRTVRGEAMITRYGIEGGAIYALGRELRATRRLEIDFKPDSSLDRLRALSQVKLSPPARAMLEAGGGVVSPERVKRFELALLGPRPVDEAISSAGGIAWPEIDEDLMLVRLPGVFVAGEMIDWEAPTGGYLLQGCFATGTRAGQSALDWIRANIPTSASASR